MGPESATRTCTTSVATDRVPVDGLAERMIFTPQLCPKGDGPDVCLITAVCDEFDALYLLSQGHSCAQLSWQHLPTRRAPAAGNTALAASTGEIGRASCRERV